MRVQRTESLIEMLSRFHPVALQPKEHVTSAILGTCVLMCSRINFSSQFVQGVIVRWAARIDERRWGVHQATGMVRSFLHHVHQHGVLIFYDCFLRLSWTLGSSAMLARCMRYLSKFDIGAVVQRQLRLLLSPSQLNSRRSPRQVYSACHHYHEHMVASTSSWAFNWKHCVA